jgi:hypothetical protein
MVLPGFTLPLLAHACSRRGWGSSGALIDIVLRDARRRARRGG